MLTVLTRGNVVQCNTEALSDHYILGPSQMVIPFNTMATLFIVHSCPHITEYYYYCKSLWLLFLSEPIISTSQLILLYLLSHVTSNITPSKYFVIYDVKAISYKICRYVHCLSTLQISYS